MNASPIGSTERACRIRPIGQGRIGCPSILVLASAIVILVTGASEPEVIRVRVPAREISKYFPPKTDLKVMSPDRFNSLVDSATRGWAGRANSRVPRLIARGTAPGGTAAFCLGTPSS